MIDEDYRRRSRVGVFMARDTGLSRVFPSMRGEEETMRVKKGSKRNLSVSVPQFCDGDNCRYLAWAASSLLRLFTYRRGFGRKE